MKIAIKRLGKIDYEERARDRDYKKRLNKEMTEKALREILEVAS